MAAWARGSTPLPLKETWEGLFSERGIRFEGATATQPPAEGERFSVIAPGGERFSGTVALSIPTEFVGFVDDLEGGIFRVDTFRAAERTGMILWVSSYAEADRPRLEAFERQAQAFLDATFHVPAMR